MVGRNVSKLCGLTLAAILLLPRVVQAQPLPVPTVPPQQGEAPPAPGTLADAIAREPQCRERTNGCQVCVDRGADGLGCSTPGIACQPDGWRCSAARPDNRDRPANP